MSNLTRLEESEINGYPRMADGIGFYSKGALDAYKSGLTNVTHAFGSKDASTVHSVIKALMAETSTIENTIDEVDAMLDSIIDLMKNEILNKEDRLASNGLEG